MIFISHSSNDLSEIMPIIGTFSGFFGNEELFMAHRDIHGGATWRQVILDKIEQCKGIIAFISKNFKASDWTGQEIGYGLAKQKKVLCVSVDETSPFGFISEEQSVKWKKNAFYEQPVSQRFPEYEFSKRRLLSSLLTGRFLKIAPLIDALETCDSYLEAETLCIPLEDNLNLIEETEINHIAKVLLKARNNNFEQVTGSAGGSRALRNIFSNRIHLISSEYGKGLKDREFFKKIGDESLGQAF